MNFKKSALASAAALSLAAAGSANADLSFESDSGWEFGVNGWIPVFAGATLPDSSEDDFGVTSGFNPASLNVSVAAPTQNGIDVSGHFQFNNHVGRGGNNTGGFGSRVAKIDIDGDFGTVSIGQGLGLFGTPAIADAGSGMGVGLTGQGVNVPDLASTGRISVGYFYADFHPRVAYFSPRTGGVQFAGAIINPTTVVGQGDIGTTDSPRFEARLDYAGDLFSLWTSGGIQNIDDVGPANDSSTMTGIDFGGAAHLGNFNLRGNYAYTEGTGGVIWGGLGDTSVLVDETEYEQWYVEGTFDAGIHTFGASYGGGSFDGESDDNLLMVFSRHSVTDDLTFMVELQDYDANGGGSAGGGEDYNAIFVGSQLNF